MTAPTVDAPRMGAQFRTLVFGENGVDLELRADGGDGRTFRGIAVPWDHEIDVDGWEYEIWRKGAFDPQLHYPQRVLVGRDHIPLGGSLIGSLRLMRNDSAGLYVEGYVSDVPDGNASLTLMRDKALRELSIGFFRIPGGDSVTRKPDGRPLYEYTRAKLFEVALVPMGAYGRKATVQGLRRRQDGSFDLANVPVAELAAEVARRTAPAPAEPETRAQGAATTPNADAAAALFAAWPARPKIGE